MKFILFSLFTAAVWAQSAPPQSAPSKTSGVTSDTVVASFADGQKVTAAELKNFLAAMPPNMQQTASRDRKKLVQQFVLMHRLAEMAEQAKLDQRNPTKDALRFNRTYILMNAELHEILDGITVTQADAQAFYEQNKDRFEQVKVKAIYIRFATPSADGSVDKKFPAEPDAEAKALKLRAALLGGADFVKLVKENSDDQTSAAKDGDFGTIRRTDNLPDAIRTTIFALKAGELSFPVRQPNGFYLFRAEELSAQPFAEVRDEIVNEVKQARFRVTMDEISSSMQLKIENEGFFTDGGAAAVSSK